MAKTNEPSVYGIEDHQHRFAAWAAGRAASVKGCRFSVKQGREILEACGFDQKFSNPEQLPVSREGMNKAHRQWRERAIQASRRHQLTGFSHGVAAKLINIYLKSRFVCGGHHAHKRVCNLHPPIDNVLLKALGEKDRGKFKKEWWQAKKKRWSKFASDDYEHVIKTIGEVLQDQPLWRIEEDWQGHQ
jgi:hypothetical protein